MLNLSRDEQESYVSQSAQDRVEGTFNLFSDDPVIVRKFEALAQKAREQGETVEEERTTAGGVMFVFRNDCLSMSLRIKRHVSAEERAAMRRRARENFAT